MHASHPWLAVGAAGIYLGMSGLCVVAWRKARGGATHGGARVWGGLAMIQLFWAADALLGIRLGVAEMGRVWFKEQGWYAEHRPFQAALSAVMLIALGVLTWGSWRVARTFPLSCRLAIGGALLALVPFLIACISMHFFEDLMDWPFGLLGLGTLARVGGCVLTGIGGWRFLRERSARET